MKQQIKGINGIRGIASIFIMIFHYFCVFCKADIALVPRPNVTRYLFLYSQYGVELFFMLSGFLIVYNYKKTLKEKTFKEFIGKRFEKLIWPILAVNLWAVINICIRTRYINHSKRISINLWHLIQSILMVCTGWVDNDSIIGLPTASTMWFVNVLLLCYIIYYDVGVKRVFRNSLTFHIVP